jgi:hypothetical protein
MAGLVPAIHVLLAAIKMWMPGTQTSLRALRKLDFMPGMTVESLVQIKRHMS